MQCLHNKMNRVELIVCRQQIAYTTATNATPRERERKREHARALERDREKKTKQQQKRKSMVREHSLSVVTSYKYVERIAEAAYHFYNIKQQRKKNVHAIAYRVQTEERARIATHTTNGRNDMLNALAA